MRRSLFVCVVCLSLFMGGGMRLLVLVVFGLNTLDVFVVCLCCLFAPFFVFLGGYVFACVGCAVVFDCV